MKEEWRRSWSGKFFEAMMISASGEGFVPFSDTKCSSQYSSETGENVRLLLVAIVTAWLL
jgi:hypothetical protein